MDNGWVAIATFVLGGLATQLTGWLDYSRRKKERAADDAAAVQQRREDFELAHLVEVNQLLRRAAEATRQLDIAKGLYGQRKQDGRLTADHQQELADAMVEFTGAVAAVDAQRGFVLADGPREATLAARKAMDVAFGEVLTDQEFSRAPFDTALATAYEQLSARVRAIYAGQAPGS
ncbi:hypothetical protein ACFYUH_24965 [Streptomyces fimicarius]|uniref:hypothetical protein n=1 Tax=Streptomyces griseus TaxID=1911 RepID=UPI0036B1049A